MREAAIDIPNDGFDAIICMGNSFAHLPDFDGDQSSHSLAIQNFYDCLKPGGVLVIDHRNYDHICAGGKAPMKNIYYQVIILLCNTDVTLCYCVRIAYQTYMTHRLNGNNYNQLRFIFLSKLSSVLGISLFRRKLLFPDLELWQNMSLINFAVLCIILSYL